ncbi:hypothetical protein IHN63_01615 [Deinococcus sp. 6YEL10]|uniref:hypothetical protein n=1 Tax=Deinococcus sp. 6YEL10 TaxID=2745870 RepID=UPI001E5F850E|nr:hypothetical protein [Deinococcus sp. 6YEL10]MCD0159996.1 hypothetical protein [Deinococcus sp. 6YEL10]
MNALTLVGLAVLSVGVLLGGLLLGAVCVRVLHAGRRGPFADHAVPLILLTFSTLIVLAGWHGLRAVSGALVGP